MLPRRKVAALLAICAFALSYSEALTAASCTMGAGVDMAMDMPMPSSDHEDNSDTPQPDCPLSMPGSPLNCVLSSAIAPKAEVVFAHIGVLNALEFLQRGHYQLLLAYTAFHPPKA